MTIQEVKETYPGSPEVTELQISNARDEVFLFLRDKLRAVPLPDTPEYKILKKAIMAYTLYNVTGGTASAMLSIAESTGRAKRYKVGPIEVEKQQSSAESDATNLRQGASLWLDEFIRLLRLLGIKLYFGVHPGVVR